MSCDLDLHVPENLRFWQQSSAPYHWVAIHQGQWQHQDWLDLVSALSRFVSGPLDVNAVGRILEEARGQWLRLGRWQKSGEAGRWVEQHQGQWSHDDWLALLEQLRQSDFWPLDTDAVGQVLEKLKVEWWNLHRWQESGKPLRWVKSHRGHWDHEDWLLLLDNLQQSEYWPLNPEQVGQVLEQARKQWENVQTWQDLGEPMRWVKLHQGHWIHDDWLSLLESLRLSDHWPLDPEAVGMVLEETRHQYDNLQRWQESGGALRWVERRQGGWDHDDYLLLLQELRQAGFWPLDPVSLERLLQATATEWKNLRRWQDSGAALEWVEQHEGEWVHGDWLALLGTFHWSGLWPVDTDAVGRVLEEVRTSWLSLQQSICGPTLQELVGSSEASAPLDEQPPPEPQLRLRYPETFDQVAEILPLSRQAA